METFQGDGRTVLTVDGTDPSLLPGSGVLMKVFETGDVTPPGDGDQVFVVAIAFVVKRDKRISSLRSRLSRPLISATDKVLYTPA